MFCAPADEPLSASGWQALQQATQALTKQDYDSLHSSPFVRCQSFARLLADTLSCPLHIQAGLQEMDFGAWTGLSSHTLWQQYPEQLKQLWDTPETFSAPQGESMPQFIQRVQSTWQNLLQKQYGKRSLLITHAGVMRVILADLLQIPYQSTLLFELKPAHALSVRVFSDGYASISGIGLPSLAARLSKHQ